MKTFTGKSGWRTAGTPEHEAYRMGIKAYDDGRALTDGPFKGGSDATTAEYELYSAWCIGWHAASFEQELLMMQGGRDEKHV